MPVMAIQAQGANGTDECAETTLKYIRRIAKFRTANS